MNEDSDTDLSDIEPENSMAGPSGAVKGGNLAALEVGLKPKNDLVSSLHSTYRVVRILVRQELTLSNSSKMSLTTHSMI